MSISLKTGGETFEKLIKEQVAGGKTPPPNAPVTIAKKGSSGTLLDKEEMLGQITSEVRGDTVVVGVIG